MIRITKPTTPPDILRPRQGKGYKLRISNSKTFTHHEADYKAGRRTFSFDSKVYGHRTVKDALIKAQSGKCCFCESKLLGVSYGDVEHFRPKAAWCQASRVSKSLTFPLATDTLYNMLVV